VELAIDPSGRILGSTWKKGSGDPVWDDSVRQVVARTTALVRPPPKGFPGRIVVRFDVQGEADALTP
jgi:TonB family protein